MFNVYNQQQWVVFAYLSFVHPPDIIQELKLLQYSNHFSNDLWNYPTFKPNPQSLYHQTCESRHAQQSFFLFFHLFSLTLTWHVLLPVIDLIYSIICYPILNNSDLKENILNRLSTQRVLPHRHPRLTLAIYFIHVNWEHTTSSPHQVTWLVS